MVMECPLETLGPKQSVGEVDEQPRRHEGRERIIECHVKLPTADRTRMRNRWTRRKRRRRLQVRSRPAWWMLSLANLTGYAGLPGPALMLLNSAASKISTETRCPVPHIISRRNERARYRNLIKIGKKAPQAIPLLRAVYMRFEWTSAAVCIRIRFETTAFLTG